MVFGDSLSRQKLHRQLISETVPDLELSEEVFLQILIFNYELSRQLISETAYSLELSKQIISQAVY